MVKIVQRLSCMVCCMHKRCAHHVPMSQDPSVPDGTPGMGRKACLPASVWCQESVNEHCCCCNFHSSHMQE